AVTARDRARDRRGAAYAALPYLLLLFVGPAVLADPFAREVYDRVDTFERGRVDATGHGVPTDRVDSGHATAREAQHPVTVGTQRLRQRRADQPVRATDRNVQCATSRRHARGCSATMPRPVSGAPSST